LADVSVYLFTVSVIIVVPRSRAAAFEDIDECHFEFPVAHGIDHGIEHGVTVA